MEELSLRDYPLGVLEKLIGSRGKQAVERKLTKFGYGFTSTESGQCVIQFHTFTFWQHDSK